MEKLLYLHIPIYVLQSFEMWFIDNPRIFYMTLFAERFYQSLMMYKTYGDETKEIADWFWWAARRHVMFRTGEFFKDEWQKGGEDFDDFLRVSNKRNYGAWHSFKLARKELNRIPVKYEKMYFHYRLDEIFEAVHYFDKKLRDPIPQEFVYEYFHHITMRMRKSFFVKKYGNDAMDKMAEFEWILYKTEKDYEREKKEFPVPLKKRPGPKTKVLRFPGYTGDIFSHQLEEPCQEPDEAQEPTEETQEPVEAPEPVEETPYPELDDPAKFNKLLERIKDENPQFLEAVLLEIEEVGTGNLKDYLFELHPEMMEYFIHSPGVQKDYLV